MIMSEENKDTVIVGFEKVPLKSEREERRKKRRQVFLTIALCLLFLVIGFGGGSLFMYKVHPINKTDTANTFGEIEGLLGKYWMYAKDYDNLQEELENKAFYGMTSFKEDPYTTYMSQEELQNFASSINMDYVGIGVVYSMQNGKPVIQRVFPKSPAEKAGLKAGDIIDKLDNLSISGYSSDEIKELVLGEKGTKIVVSVIRNNANFEFSVIRDSIDSSVYCYAKDNYIVMELSSFGNNTAKECMNYLDQYSNYDRIIIDLRSNTGGYQTSVKEIAGLFIGNNQVYLRQKNSDGVETADLTVCEKTYDNLKKYVLIVNGETASAAEVFAICLKEQLEDVTIVGEKTYGKGVIQSTNYLLNGGVLKFTSYNWYSPNGVSIQNEGIKPDIEVKLSDLSYEYYIEMSEDEEYKYDSVSTITAICEKALLLLGYDVDRQDGYFDLSFEKALNSYKTHNDLKVDGTLDLDTYSSIISSAIYCLGLEENDYQFIKAVELINE